MGSNRMTWVVGLTAGALTVACGGDDPGSVGPPPPQPTGAASIEIVPPPGPLVSLGEFTTLSATVRDQAGAPMADQEVTWSSLDPGIVTASVTGRIVAVANGTARVTAAVADVSDTVTIVVQQRVASVRISPSLPVLELVGETISATAQPVDARDNDVAGAGPVTWAATGAISVQPPGLVQATGFGFGTLTATSGAVSSSVTVEVIGDRFFLSDGVRLRYELDLPAGAPGPFPAIIWVHGSGPLNRNSQRIGTDPLVPFGLAVLRYDKRGVGESGGVFNNGDLPQLARDAAAGLRFLARLPQVDTARIGAMGNSQGGWLVPMAAVTVPEIVKYMMFWSGPTVSVGLEIFYSNLAEGTPTPLDSVYAQLANFNGAPGYDPLADITSLDIPGLWQYGELDRSIPMRLDVQRLQSLQLQGKPFEMVLWPFGDHSLRDTRINQFYDVWSEYLRFLRAHGILTQGS